MFVGLCSLIATDWFGLIFNHEIAKPGYESTPQKELNGRTMWAPRAMVTGGCMAHNAYVVVRGSKPAYDEWDAKAPGWSYNDLAPHWETVLNHFDFTTNDGSIRRPDKNGEYIDSMVDICKEAGWALNEEFNMADGPHNGCNYRQHQGVLDTDSAGEPFIRRQTAYTQFIQPILKDRPNLHVMTNQRVSKIEIEGTNAKGVHVEDPWSSGSFYYEATKEVILSAGVYDTPKLLMLSGVGPADHLSDMGIAVVKDMPGVGSRLVDDSFSFITGPALKEQPETWDSIWGKSPIRFQVCQKLLS
jgi:choline dehydrogenase-like flavoprotein